MARVIRETLKIRAIRTIRAIHMAPTTRVIRTIRATHIVRTARTEPAAGLAWVSGLLVAVSLPLVYLTLSCVLALAVSSPSCTSAKLT